VADLKALLAEVAALREQATAQEAEIRKLAEKNTGLTLAAMFADRALRGQPEACGAHGTDWSDEVCCARPRDVARARRALSGLPLPHQTTGAG